MSTSRLLVFICVAVLLMTMTMDSCAAKRQRLTRSSAAKSKGNSDANGSGVEGAGGAGGGGGGAGGGGGSGDGKESFSACLTDCVRSLQDQFDHTQLFECSAKCEELSGLSKKLSKKPKGMQEMGEKSADIIDDDSGIDATSTPTPASSTSSSSATTTTISAAAEQQEPTPSTHIPVPAPSSTPHLTMPSHTTPKLNLDAVPPPIPPPTSDHMNINSNIKIPKPPSSTASGAGGMVRPPTPTTTSSSPSSSSSSSSEQQQHRHTSTHNAHMQRGSVGGGAAAGGIKLHIGPGPNVVKANNRMDWTFVDVRDVGAVDLVADARNLSSFESESVSVIYASHVLQLFHYRMDDEIMSVLREWHRVLVPGGELFISVPDMPTLCWLYLNPNLAVNARFRILQVMMGGQEHVHDVHKAGFDMDFLGHHLSIAGFSEYERVPQFDLFNDLSSRKMLDTFLSLNVIARKPAAPHRRLLS